MSFIHNNNKNVQNKQTDSKDLETNEYVTMNTDTEFEQEVNRGQKGKTIFDQMEQHDHSVSNTEPITWDAEPFNVKKTDTSFPLNQEENAHIDHDEDLFADQKSKETAESVDENHDVDILGIESQQEQDKEQSDVIETELGNESKEYEEVKSGIAGLNTYIQDQFDSVDKQLNKLANDFETKLKYDQHKDKVIDNLHKELQMYKDNSFQERLMPVIMDLILSIDRTGKLLKGLPAEEEHSKFIKVINESIMDLEDILYKQGVETYETEGTSFDATRQKIIKTIKTDRLENDKQVAERLGKGYEWEDRIIRKEQVSVYVYEQTGNQSK
jgi:molecular chaperone GrpE